MPGRQGYHNDKLCIRLDAATRSNVSVAPSHPVALRAGTSYMISGRVLSELETGLEMEMGREKLGEQIRSSKNGQWTDFQRPVTTGADQWWLGPISLRVSGKGGVWLSDLALREQEGGPNLLWEADLNRPPRRTYNQLDSFMLDQVVEAAERNGIYLQLCLLTRDHYQHHLKNPDSLDYQEALEDAKRLLRYSVARWGYSANVVTWEYFNEMDPGLPLDRFYRDLGLHLETMDPYKKLRATSAWSPSPKDWTHPQLDIADLHWYLRPAWGDIWKDEVAAVMDRAKLLRDRVPGKPAFLGEIGLADDQWRHSPHMDADKDWVHFHNINWASAFSGLSGSGLFWWWETLDTRNAYPGYAPLAAFLAALPFTTANLQTRSSLTSPSHCRVFSLQGEDCAYLWVFNPQATWWKQVVDKTRPDEIREDSLVVEGLDKGAYKIQWWDTWEGKSLRETSVIVSGPRLDLPIPVFNRDVACKVTRQANR